jgi:hypothetical protein
MNIFDIAVSKKTMGGSNSGPPITITNIVESSEDGGNNIITFSDGSTLTVKNGSKGSQGVGSLNLDKTLTIEDYAADAKTTGDRLLNVEYQTIATEEAYEHKDLPVGEKIVTVNNDGTWGDKAYYTSGEDMVPRAVFNINKSAGETIEYTSDGFVATKKEISITKNKNYYHIEGNLTAPNYVSFLFGSSLDNDGFKIPFKNKNGKSFKIYTFANASMGGKLTVAVNFYKINPDPTQSDTKVTVINKNGALKDINGYVAYTTNSGDCFFTIPNDADIDYMQFIITAYKDYEFNHDFCIYMAEMDGNKYSTAMPLQVTDETSNVSSFPYPSTVTTKIPLFEYINYKADNAKGDAATYLTPEAFGAAGDGYVNDTEAIKQCLAAAENTKQYVLMAKKYLTLEPIEIYGTGLNVQINDVIYNGDDAAVKIRGQQNTIKIHSIDSAGVGIKFMGDGELYADWTLNNHLEVNTIKAKSHGIVFDSTTTSISQNVVHFNLINAGGKECYGITYQFGEGSKTYITENNFYGGQIMNCDWAVYKVAGNSRLINIQVEGDVKGGFYIVSSVSITNPRWAESSRDGEYPFFKFVGNNLKYITIDGNTVLPINEIDLSEASNTNVSGIGVAEGAYVELNFPIISRRLETGKNVNIPALITNSAIILGNYLILQPYMAYRKVITTPELDTRLLGKESGTTQAELDAAIKQLSQLPTRFVVNKNNTKIYLHESYCAFGYDEFEVEQAGGFTCEVYDKVGKLLFNGKDQGDGLYKFKCYKDCDKCNISTGVGLLRVNFGDYDTSFVGQHWEIVKENIITNEVI